MLKLATALTALTLAGGLAACGDDEEDTATTPATTTTEARGYEPAGDEPFTVEATIDEIEEVEGDTLLTAKSTEGKTYKVLVPPDVTLEPRASEVLNDPACAGKILANLELVAAPDHEERGDSILVSADIDTENC